MSRSRRSKRGRQSQKEGKAFEAEVERIYRLLRYRVERGREFESRQVDLFMTKTVADYEIIRAVECKSGDVGTKELDEFIIKLRLVRREYPRAEGTLVSKNAFTDKARTHAHREGIQLQLYHELQGALFNGEPYAHAMISEVESSDRYPLDLYIEQQIGTNPHPSDAVPAFECLAKWLAGTKEQFLVVLGDVGTGKTFLSRLLAYRLALEYVKAPSTAPLPIRIDLRLADREFSLEGLVLNHFQKNGIGDISFEMFQYGMREGRIILILDGFDEMSARVTSRVTERNFAELARCMTGGTSRAFLTCRTHYFKSTTEEKEVLLGVKDDIEVESARELYFDLVSRRGFGIAYLRPFTLDNIEQYVRKARPDDLHRSMEKIRGTYNLLELSQRPLLLEMIVKSLDKLETDDINAASLYGVFTSVWVQRDVWRGTLTQEEKLNFLTGLAVSLWANDKASIHYTELEAYLLESLRAKIQEPQHAAEFDAEIRTATFLTRDDVGNYSFAHRSFKEYFVAKYVSDGLNEGNTRVLRHPPMSSEIVGFVQDMINVNAKDILEKQLTTSYVQLVSENALICLYDCARLRQLAEPQSLAEIAMPPNMKLGGAKLSGMSFEGVRIEGADLSRADLTNCDLRRAFLVRCDLKGALLTNADLSRATLENVTADEALADGVQLSEARLTAVSLRSATMNGAILNPSVISDVDLEGVDVRGAVIGERIKALLRVPTTGGAARPSPAAQSPQREFLRSHYYSRFDFDAETVRAVHQFSAHYAERYGLERGYIASATIIRLAEQGLPESSIRKTYLVRLVASVSSRLLSEMNTRAEAEASAVDSETQDEEPMEIAWIELVDYLRGHLSERAWTIAEPFIVNGKSTEEIATELNLSQSYVAKVLGSVRRIGREWGIRH